MAAKLKLSLVITLVILSVSRDVSAQASSFADGLLFYAPFDGNATPWKYTGSGGTAENKSWVFASGKSGQGISIGNGNPAISYYAEGNLGQNTGSMAFWVKLGFDTNSGDSSSYRYFWGVQPGPLAIICWWGNNKKIYFSTFITSWIWEPSSTINSMQQDTWHHFVFTWTASQKKIYKDGILAATGTSANWSYMVGSTMTIGCHPTTGDQFAEGVYDDFALWNRALTDQEVGELYNGYNGGANPFSTVPKTPSPEELNGPVLFTGTLLNTSEKPVLYRGSTAAIRVSIQNTTTQPLTLNAIYKFLNYQNNPVQTITQQISLPASGTIVNMLPFLGMTSGIFKMIVEYTPTGGQTYSQDIVIFGILPQTSSAENVAQHENSMFGIHTALHSVFNPQRHLKIANKAGMEWDRAHDADAGVTWYYAEPSQDQFDYTRAEACIPNAESYGVHILGVLESTPYWASSAPGKNSSNVWTFWQYPANDINDWRDYVSHIVSHYKGRIEYWEIWNEADTTTFWMGTPQQYVDYVRVAYQAAKAADPNCKILAGGALPKATEAWTRQVFAAGLLNYMDILSFHGYGEPSFTVYYPETAFANSTYIDRVAYLKDLMGQYGQIKPMWDTETTVFGRTFYSRLNIPDVPPANLWPVEAPAVAASELVKLYAINFGLGIEKVFYYYMDNVSFLNTAHYHQSMFEYDGAPTSRLMAYSVMAQLFAGARFYRQADLGMNNYAYVFEKPNGSVAVLWSQASTGRTVNIVNCPHTLAATDIMGNPKSLNYVNGQVDLILSREPVYLTSDLPASNLVTILSKSVMSSDLNCDGKVDFSDLKIFLDEWLKVVE